jgi:tetratricopeptide (TPR) repeat protein
MKTTVQFPLPVGVTGRLSEKRGRRWLKVLAMATGLAIAGTQPTAAETALRITPESWAAELGAKRSPLSAEDMIDAALLLSGARGGALETGRTMLRRAVADVEALVDRSSPAYEKGEQVLAYLHDRYLVRYSEPQTRVDVLLSKGTHNCVSSAVVYMILARAVGLSVKGVSTPDHAFCAVATAARHVDVETTTRYGFDPGRKKEFTDAFGNTTGFSYVAPGNYALRSDITDKELLGLILQNRISILEKQKNFAEAAALAVDRYAFLGGGDKARNDMVKELINHAAYLNAASKYRDALSFVDRARAQHGGHPEFTRIAQVLVHNRTVELSNSGRLEEARALIRERRDTGDLSAADAATLRTTVGEQYLNTVVRRVPFEDAVRLVEEMFADEEISAARRRDFLIYLYGTEAERLGRSRDFLGALEIIQEAISMVGPDARLLRAEAANERNYEALMHNRFADRFNRKDYTGAAEVLRQALREMPDSRRLREDQALLRKAQR